MPATRLLMLTDLGIIQPSRADTKLNLADEIENEEVDIE